MIKNSRSINNRLLKETPYYKPVLWIKDDLERVEDMPIDRQEQMKEDASPTPRFKLDILPKHGDKTADTRVTSQIQIP